MSVHLLNEGEKDILRHVVDTHVVYGIRYVPTTDASTSQPSSSSKGFRFGASASLQAPEDYLLRPNPEAMLTGMVPQKTSKDDTFICRQHLVPVSIKYLIRQEVGLCVPRVFETLSMYFPWAFWRVFEKKNFCKFKRGRGDSPIV